MYTKSRSQYKEWSLDQNELDSDLWKEIRDEIIMGKSTFSAPQHTEVELTYENHGDRELSGVIIDAGLNHPTMRFEDGSHGFLSLAGSTGDDLRLLFQKSWDGKSGRRYKYKVTDITIRSYWFETPVCPTCDVDMEYGMPRDLDREEFPVSSWLCPECFPGSYEGGIK